MNPKFSAYSDQFLHYLKVHHLVLISAFQKVLVAKNQGEKTTMNNQMKQLPFKKGLKGLGAFNLENRCLGDEEEQG